MSEIPEGWTAIELLCDDPRHKPYLVDTFAALLPPEGAGEWITIEQLKPSGTPAPTGWRDHTQGDVGGPVHSYRCDKCPPRTAQQIEVTNETLQWLLDTVAAQGMSQPTLRILNLIVSNRT